MLGDGGAAGFAVSAIGLFSAFVADRLVLGIGVTILTAQLVAMVANGFTGLLTSLFQATGRSVPAMVMSVSQGVLFIPIVLLGNLWFGLAGIIWALTVTEVIVFLVGLVLWFGSRWAIDRGLATPEIGRRVAADRILASEPIDVGPVDDLLRELHDLRGRRA